MRRFSPTLILLLPFSLAACVPAEAPRPEPSPQDLFFERLSMLCDKAYAGEMVSDEEVDADFAGKEMIIHVAQCELDRIMIPLHVAGEGDEWDRSRTWIISRTGEGLRLKHRHRHEDGTLDEVTNYGGDTADPGTASRQEFPVDEESIASFKANDLEGSITNVWAVEVSEPGQGKAYFAYELRRPESSGGRFFRAEFDLAQPVPAPPPPWGE